MSNGAALQEQLIGDFPAVTYEMIRADWEQARVGYSGMRRATPNRTDVQERLQIVERRRRLLDAEHEYAPQIDIRNLKHGEGTRRFGGQDAHGIFGEVKNVGDQSVVKLVLLFELLDAASKPIAEKEWTLVIEGSDEGPLKSNYTRPFGFAVDRPPSDWVGVRGSVKLVRLSRDGARFPDEKPVQSRSPSGN